MKLQKKLYTIVNTVIRILLVLIVSGLLLQSMFSTSFIGVVVSEDGFVLDQTRNIADYPWRHLAVFAAVTALGVLAYRVSRRWGYRKVCQANEETCPDSQYNIIQRKDSVKPADECSDCGVNEGPEEKPGRSVSAGNGAEPGTAQCSDAKRTVSGFGIRRDDKSTVRENDVHNRRIFLILSIFVLAMGTLWLMVTQLQPGSDPAKVYGIAMQWRAGNFSSYAEGGYLFRYPFQAGIILFYYLLSFVFGVDNYIGLQLVNVIALIAVYVLLSKLAALFWKKEEKLPVLVYAALILWMPLAFYVTYLYGILPGMALSLGAVYCVMKYLDSRKYRYILPACICMGLATVIKMNCLIYLIAAACFLLYDAVENIFCRSGYTVGNFDAEKRKPAGRALVSLAVVVLMALSVKGCNEAVNRYVERLSGYKAGNGFEMLSWVVMGLQETPLGPGGYSGYIGDIYVEYDYDADKVREAAWTDIKKALTRMSENPLDEGAPFFARKNAFQWNDPSFISLDRTKGRSSAIEMPGFVSSLIDGRGSVVFYVLMNYAQTLLLIGMLLYVFLNWKSRNLYELMGAVIFLGGYLFHFVWESSASYTIPYFVVMIPYAVKGLADWVRYVSGLPAYMAQNRQGTVGKRELVGKLGAPVGGIVAATVFVTMLSNTNLFYRTIALNDGEEARAQFYHEEESTPENLVDGYYYLVPFTAQDMTLAEADGKVTIMSVVEAERSNGSAGDIEGVSGTDEEENAGKTTNAGSTGSAEALENTEPSIYVPDIDNIEQKILLHKENGRGAAGYSTDTGVSIRFRSNEQVLAVEQEGESFRLTVYMDDGMNMFYESKENISYLWKLYGTPEEGYYIVLGDMALTYRDGAVVLDQLNRDETQKWMFR